MVDNRIALLTQTADVPGAIQQHTAGRLANQLSQARIDAIPGQQAAAQQKLELDRATAARDEQNQLIKMEEFLQTQDDRTRDNALRTSQQILQIQSPEDLAAFRASNPIDTKGLENIQFGSPEFLDAQRGAGILVRAAQTPTTVTPKAGSLKTFLNPKTGETFTADLNNPADVDRVRNSSSDFVVAPSKIEQGTPGAFGPTSPLTKGTKTTIQKAQAGLEDSFERVGLIRKEFDRDFLTFEGGIKAATLNFLDKANFTVSPEGREFITKRKKFVTKIKREFNLYRKAITGAAAAEKELADLKQATINEDLGPIEFLAALDEYEDELKRGLRINRRLLREGIKVGDKDFGEAHDRLWNTSADDDSDVRLEELVAQGDLTDEQIDDILIEEGYQ